MSPALKLNHTDGHYGTRQRAVSAAEPSPPSLRVVKHEVHDRELLDCGAG